MKNIHTTIKLLLGLLLAAELMVLSGCKTASPNSPAKEFLPTSEEKIRKNDPAEVSVMTYNVENLFDTVHDKNREDFTYLPLSEKMKPEVIAYCSTLSSYRRQECEKTDWNETVLKTKLDSIANVIRKVDAGTGPDVLLLAEVENESILKRLVSEKLGDLGYKTVVLLEGPDMRGIDPAFISKFALVAKPILHLVPYADADQEQLKMARRSRGILEVTVELPNKRSLTFLVAHFPSQSNPTEWRAQAVAFAKKLITEKMKQGKAVILGGDLNITTEENTTHGYYSKELSEVGLVSHVVGCTECLGTHNYKGHWDFLDAFVFSKNLADAKAMVLTDSFQVVRTYENSKKNGTPLPFDITKAVVGASDHFPLYTKIKMLQ